MTDRLDVSIVMLFEREGETGERALQALLDQKTGLRYEVVLVGSRFPAHRDDRIVRLPEPDRNPARRRNRGAGIARGEIVAFIDDDAFAADDWVETGLGWLREHREAVAAGGPDPAPSDSSLGERISDVLLSSRFIGSGIAAHEYRKEQFDVRRASDIALVNLFVRSDALRQAGGFDESIGYIGEDTAAIAQLMKLGRVRYLPQLVVYHRRRTFPAAFLRQRWRYRVKTGQMIASGRSSYLRDVRVWVLLLAPLLALFALFVAPRALLAAAIAYAAVTFVLAAPKLGRIPFWLWPLTPLFFGLHHATYALAILWGVADCFLRRARSLMP